MKTHRPKSKLNPVHFALLYSCLPVLTEAIIEGRIKGWREFKNILIKKKVVRVLGKLEFVAPTKGKRIIPGKAFRKRARCLAKADGKRILGEKEYQYYKQGDNQHLLPKSKKIRLIVFINAKERVGGKDCVYCLKRFGDSWDGKSVWIDSSFDNSSVVAVG